MGFYGIFNHFSIKILFKITRWSVSRILYLILKVVTINLELLLPTISSVLPCPTQSHVCQVLTRLFWTCSQRGLHYHICYQICGGLLPHPFHPYRRRRYIFCCTFPRVTPAGSYPALVL